MKIAGVTMPTMPSLPKKPPVSKQRVFYSQPSGIKPDLMPLYQRVAADLDFTPAQVRAFAVVESDEKPFTPSGAPLPRLEVHHWKKHRVADRASIAFDTALNYRNLDARWEQFERMRKVNETAAILSHSFGLFQIVGFNFQLCSCADPATFLTEMMTVDGQFKMFKRFMLRSPALLSAVRRNLPEQIGFHYNGPQYKRHKYDVRWASASRAGGSLAWV
jgi:hypothetical protein